jgi:hypothetical protein
MKKNHASGFKYNWSMQKAKGVCLFQSQKKHNHDEHPSWLMTSYIQTISYGMGIRASTNVKIDNLASDSRSRPSVFARVRVGCVPVPLPPTPASPYCMQRHPPVGALHPSLPFLPVFFPITNGCVR